MRREPREVPRPAEHPGDAVQLVHLSEEAEKWLAELHEARP